jgi:hypothetical protein
MSLIVVLTNKSNLAPVSDYNYQVLVGDGTPARSTLVASGEIRGHERIDGWKKLVQRVIDEAHHD